MNIKVQCCGIVLIVLLIIILNRRRKLDLITSKIFQACCYGTLVALVLDVLSIFGIVFRDVLPAALPELVCKSYIASLIVVSVLAVVYIATGVAIHLPEYKRYIAIYVSFAAIIIVLIYILPITMHEDTERALAWTTGPSTLVTYFGAFTLIVLNIGQIFRHKAYIYERQRETVLIWMGLWITAAVVQALVNELLIVGFASALSMMLLFLQFENPELYLDRNTGLFNYIGYTRLGEELYSGNDPFYVLAVIFENPGWQDMLQATRGTVEAQRVYDTFLQVPGAKAFKIQESEVLLVFNREEDAQAAWKMAHEKLHPRYAESLLSRPALFYMPNPRMLRTPRELLELLRYVHQQKNSGAGGVLHEIDDSVAAQIMTEHATTQMIMDALNEDRIVVHYQPIYSVEKHRFTRAEALVRIVDRDGKLVMPGAFIQAAENNGLIIDIGRRVFEKVCRFYRNCGLEDCGIESIEVNLSIMQCANDKLADDYIAIMKATGMNPARVNLEITESASPYGRQTLLTNMERLIDYGVSFSLDDFGTGASNLNYIVDMPVKIVKFDRGMILAYFASGKAKYVMDAAMHMIHGMGLEIVAEGIETEEQFSGMEDIRINFIQGYYFSKPLEEDAFLTFLRRENGADAIGKTRKSIS